MATFHPELAGAFPVADAAPLAGPLMTLDDWTALTRAPKRAPGTEVSVRARPIGKLGGWKDHMFVHYDDGRAQLIARGGPSEEGASFFPSLVDGSNRVLAEVTPEAASRDYDFPYRTIASTFLPGVSAEQAAAEARAHALGVDRLGNGYGWRRNSNSYAADVAAPLFGYRPGDRRTPGYDQRLRDDVPPPAPQGSVFTGPLRVDDWTPIIRNPPY
jgi:hypothetical protein